MQKPRKFRFAWLLFFVFEPSQATKRKEAKESRKERILLKLVILKLWEVKQRKLHLSPSHQPLQDFPLISAERNILLIEVPVPCFYLLKQSALRMFAITEQTTDTYIIG